MVNGQVILVNCDQCGDDVELVRKIESSNYSEGYKEVCRKCFGRCDRCCEEYVVLERFSDGDDYVRVCKKCLDMVVNCGECNAMIHYEESYSDSNNDCYCEFCYDQFTRHCKGCDEVYKKDDMHCYGENEDYFCDRCDEDVCEECNNVSKHDLKDVNGRMICNYCEKLMKTNGDDSEE